MSAEPCANGCGRRAIFFYKKKASPQRVRVDKDHHLCLQCWRDAVNAEAAKKLARKK